jgi:hypothetical protein
MPIAAPAEVLREAAAHYYEVCELYEDDDLDPDDHLAVIKRACTSSDCDEFSGILHAMTGWPVVRPIWEIPDWGLGHHSLLRAPDGRLLDVTGWTDIRKLERRYGGRKGVRITLAEASVPPRTYSFPEDDALLASVIRSLPHAPFGTKAFRAITCAPVPGVDGAFEDPCEPATGPHDLG